MEQLNRNGDFVERRRMFVGARTKCQLLSLP